VIQRCCDGDVPCGPVNSIAEIFAEEQFWVRDTLIVVAHECVGDLAVPGVIPRLSETPGSIQHLGGKLGERNAEVFRDWLDIEENELAALQKAGVV
jgi:crotonobetainyl-CoA:carnitine CoA-transferase CaiB-like acyl-CoA transferase